LTGKTIAVTGNSLGGNWTDSSSKIGDWLKTDSLYQVQKQKAELTVADFLAFSDVSVLFGQTHAAVA